MNSRYALPAEPRDPFVGPEAVWNRRELIVSATLYVLGGIGLFIAWRGSAGEADWHDTANWLVLATASVSVAGLGILVWLALGKVRIAAAKRAVSAGLVERRRDRLAAATAVLDADFITAAGMRRYHRPDCLLMVGKEAVAVTPETSSLRACGVCAS